VGEGHHGRALGWGRSRGWGHRLIHGVGEGDAMERRRCELRATMEARRMRTTVAGLAWSEGASEDKGARAMAMMAARDRWYRETAAGRMNHGSEVSF